MVIWANDILFTNENNLKICFVYKKEREKKNFNYNFISNLSSAVWNVPTKTENKITIKTEMRKKSV